MLIIIITPLSVCSLIRQFSPGRQIPNLLIHFSIHIPILIYQYLSQCLVKFSKLFFPNKSFYSNNILYMCDVVIYNKNNIDGLHPHFWHRVPKTLWVSQVVGGGEPKGVLYYVNQVLYGKHLWTVNHMIRKLKLQIWYPDIWGRKVARDGIQSQMVQSCVMKPPLKTQKDRFLRASGLVNTWKFGESGTAGEGMEALRPFQHTLLYACLLSGYS